MPIGNIEQFTEDTPVDDVIRVLERLKAKPDPIAYCKKYSGKTWGELMIANLTDPECRDGWTHWYLIFLGERSSATLRKGSIACIRHPMTAFALYCDLDFFTEEEEKLLIAKFKGKLPMAEKELATGVVVRKKV